MSAHNVGPITLTIANGQTDSPALSTLLSAGQMKALLGSLVGFVVGAPAALTGTITVQVVHTEGGSTWTDLAQASGADPAITAGNSTPFNTGAFRDMRIHSSAAEGAERQFPITFQVTVTD